MIAQSETAFYALELSKILIPVGAIALILAATVSLHRAKPGPNSKGLVAITGLWLLVTSLGRCLLSAPVMHHYLSGHHGRDDEAQALEFYSAVTSVSWVAEQVLLLLFAILLFLVVRSTWHAKSA